MDDYKKQKAVIVPEWVLDLMIGQLDTQLDALCQERDWNLKAGAPTEDIVVEIELYETALKQLASQ
jgi:hypothetical protein